jgi:hypothetical protein
MSMILVFAAIIVLILLVLGIWYSVRMEQTSQKVSPKDIFLHLLGIATLYASAISFSALLFDYIDMAFPRALQDIFYAAEGLRNSIRLAVSTLIVVFPVFFLVSRALRKAYEADPGRINLAIRKWLSYFTMFLAGIIGIGSGVAVIYRFLGGDFTIAFLLKALVIFFVTGSVFYYYRAITRGEEAKSKVRIFANVEAAIVLIAIIAAFFFVGSPKQQRLISEDMRRVSDLQSIQSQLGNYFMNKEKLPKELAELNDAFRNVEIPNDPVTGKPYEYRAKGEVSFELCAEFALPFDPATQNGGRNGSIAYPMDMYYGPYGSNWKHDAGRYCFERTIDKDYFKPAPVKGI